MKIVQIVRLFLTGLIGLLVPAAASASPLFDAEETLHITIEAPFRTLFKDLLNEDVYVEAQLTVEGQAGLPVRVKPRGKTRRSTKVCNFPPLTVNFKKKGVEGTVFASQDKLKLVTHCQDRKENYQVYYRQEFHIYKMYNLLTEMSFRVRPAEITYVDTDGKRETITRFAFFIEDADELATRTGLSRYKTQKIRVDELGSFEASRFTLFQYLIANLDWATRGGPPGENCCHNSKPFIDGAGVVTSVPYDFDFAGVINARYASLPEGIKLNNMKTRLYRGLCVHNETVPAVIDLINAKREAITLLYQTSPHLEDRDAVKTIKFYDGFFKTVNDPKSLDRKIIQKCRG